MVWFSCLWATRRRSAIGSRRAPPLRDRECWSRWWVVHNIRTLLMLSHMSTWSFQWIQRNYPLLRHKWIRLQGMYCASHVHRWRRYFFDGSVFVCSEDQSSRQQTHVLRLGVQRWSLRCRCARVALLGDGDNVAERKWHKTSGQEETLHRCRRQPRVHDRRGDW